MDKRPIIAHVVIAHPTNGWFYLACDDVQDDMVTGFVDGMPTNYEAHPRGLIVAQFTDEPGAKAAVARAKERERILRPMWQMAIEQVERVRRTMQYEVFLAATHDETGKLLEGVIK